MKRLIFLSVLALTASSLVSLSGCALDNPFEADKQQSQEISVTPETVGQLAVATMGQSQAYSGSLGAANTALTPLETAGNNSMTITGLQKGLAKAGNATAVMATDPIIDYSDTALGIIRYIASSADLLGCVSNDTVTVQAANTDNWISLAGTKTCINRIESYSVTDADGNGIAGGLSEVNPKVRTVITVEYTAADVFGHKAGQIETLVLTGGAGPDNDWNTENDNIAYEISWLRMMGSDTLAYAVYTDADGDGLIIDNGSSQPSMIDVALFEKDPPFNIFVDYSRLNLRIITGGTEADGQIVKLNGEEKLITGRINSIVVLDAEGDSVISDSEIAEAIFAAVWAPVSDSIISCRASIVFDPVDGLANDDDNLYYELHLSEEKRFVIVRKMTYDFTTDEAVPEGGKPVSGHLEMSVEYADGRTASIVADFTPGYFTGTYTAPDGSTTTVTWDSTGKVVSQS